MGKHRQDPVNCPMCGGDKVIRQNQDNKEIEIPCPGCNGTGKQP
ncbi:hypothetical protein RIF23_14395 [Lipingzhangella sp. LS1_29]|uniref:Molecular chaperone DnaJ n=1 Tax=Lipingzhangella rawalii TaxID=2055835 RepID=A0ABU2H9F9_9ACTN|nr:hypothetical protein [Lipingzhangella rawalii]MDS1271485.1 hypothetical protein [Lipingzhangella rawalii]